MVDSRNKGRTAETKAKEELIKLTGLKWERTPGSGALDAKHGLKGDLYIPQVNNRFCVEVKHYKDDHLTSKILTSKDPQLMEWWKQTVRQSIQTSKLPLLLFKFDRSKWFVCFHSSLLNFEEFKDRNIPPRYMAVRDTVSGDMLNICLLTDFAKNIKVWVNA